MKLDLNPQQTAWLRDTLRRVEEGQHLDDEEQAALDTYYNAEYYEWLQDREADGRPLTEEQVRHYMQLVNVMDKAGAYAIQEHGELIIQEIAGDYDNIVGLPLTRLLQVLQG